MTIRTMTPRGLLTALLALGLAGCKKDAPPRSEAPAAKDGGAAPGASAAGAPEHKDGEHKDEEKEH